MSIVEKEKHTFWALFVCLAIGASYFLFTALASRRSSGRIFAYDGDDMDELSARDAAFIKRIKMDSGSTVNTMDDISFDDIIGQSDAKDAIMKAIIWPAMNENLFQGLRTPPPAVLLYGPPGTGKTMLVRAVMTVLMKTLKGVSFFNVSASTFAAKYHGDGERLVRCLFKAAAESQRSVIFIDEIDAILSSRAMSNDDASLRVKTEFLINLDGLVKARNVVLIAATNLPHHLDPAFLRRCGRKVKVGLPSGEERFELLKKLFKDEKHSITESEMYSFAHSDLHSYSSSDVYMLAREAAVIALDSVLQTLPIKSITPADIPSISINHLRLAKVKVKPSFGGHSTLKDIENWEKNV